MLKLAAVAVALSIGASVHGASSPSIEWQGCSPNPLIQCGTYQVPLDYANSSAGYATLAVARYKSYRTPRLGTLFVNPGGPGGSGTDMIQNGIGDVMSNDTNGQYDLVGWDPRGVNLSTPAISCGFTSDDKFAEFLGPTSILNAGLQVHGNFTDQKDIDSFYSQMNATDAQLTEFGQQCADVDGDFLQYMGSAAAARDIINLSDYLEGPGQKINYWGVSYGTIIGNYLVNMFPDRVGRVVIDGVVQANDYSTLPAYKMWRVGTQSVEATFAGFTQACAAAGPAGCAIAEEGSTPESVAQWVRELIDTAYAANRSDIADSYHLRENIMEQLYTPVSWPTLAQALDMVASNFTSLANSSTSTSTMRKRAAANSVLTNGSNQVSELVVSSVITCLDSIDQDDVPIKEVFDELLNVTHNQTPMFGEAMLSDPGFYCHNFPIRAVERFTGPFNHELSYPILVIGNEADPITPLASAKSVAAELGNSAYLVEQDDFGHSSLAERSDCTRAVVSDYFLQGKLPETSKVCGTNQVLFPGPGVTKGSLAAVSGVSSGTSSDSTLSSQVSDLQRTRTIFLIVTCVLAVLTAVLAIALVVTCLNNRKNKRYASPAAAAILTNQIYSDGRGSIDEHQQLYSDPWEGKKQAY